MAATVSSPWAKPKVGSWALDSEENEAELQQQEQKKPYEEGDGPADFPSLSAAISTKSKKKKKGQTLSLAEFTTYSAAANPTFQAKGLTHDDLLALPTGPRERTAEELERSRLGGGFRSYGSNNRNRDGDDSSNSRWGANSRVSDETRRTGGGFGRDSEFAPSRADEIDNWASVKKSMVGNGFERRERGGSGGGFFDNHSKADESDNWGSNKSFVPSEGRRFGGGGGGFERERRGGFEFTQSGGAVSDSWGKKKFETSERSYTNGGSADSDLWAKKKEDGGGTVNGSARPRINLKPRTLPVVSEVQQQVVSEAVVKPKGSNPFGEARPREEVLAEKGQDWKKIDEQLEAMKIKDVGGGEGVGNKSFGSLNGRVRTPEDRVERSWRKPETVEVSSPRSEKVEEAIVEQN